MPLDPPEYTLPASPPPPFNPSWSSRNEHILLRQSSSTSLRTPPPPPFNPSWTNQAGHNLPYQPPLHQSPAPVASPPFYESSSPVDSSATITVSEPLNIVIPTPSRITTQSSDTLNALYPQGRRTDRNDSPNPEEFTFVSPRQENNLQYPNQHNFIIENNTNTDIPATTNTSTIDPHYDPSFSNIEEDSDENLNRAPTRNFGSSSTANTIPFSSHSTSSSVAGSPASVPEFLPPPHSSSPLCFDFDNIQDIQDIQDTLHVASSEIEPIALSEQQQHQIEPHPLIRPRSEPQPQIHPPPLMRTPSVASVASSVSSDSEFENVFTLNFSSQNTARLPAEQLSGPNSTNRNSLSDQDQDQDQDQDDVHDITTITSYRSSLNSFDFQNAISIVSSGSSSSNLTATNVTLEQDSPLLPIPRERRPSQPLSPVPNFNLPPIPTQAQILYNYVPPSHPPPASPPPLPPSSTQSSPVESDINEQPTHISETPVLPSSSSFSSSRSASSGIYSAVTNSTSTSNDQYSLNTTTTQPSISWRNMTALESGSQNTAAEQLSTSPLSGSMFPVSNNYSITPRGSVSGNLMQLNAQSTRQITPHSSISRQGISSNNTRASSSSSSSYLSSRLQEPFSPNRSQEALSRTQTDQSDVRSQLSHETGKKSIFKLHKKSLAQATLSSKKSIASLTTVPTSFGLSSQGDLKFQIDSPQEHYDIGDTIKGVLHYIPTEPLPVHSIAVVLVLNELVIKKNCVSRVVVVSSFHIRDFTIPSDMMGSHGQVHTFPFEIKIPEFLPIPGIPNPQSLQRRLPPSYKSISQNSSLPSVQISYSLKGIIDRDNFFPPDEDLPSKISDSMIEVSRPIIIYPSYSPVDPGTVGLEQRDAQGLKYYKGKGEISSRGVLRQSVALGMAELHVIGLQYYSMFRTISTPQSAEESQTPEEGLTNGSTESEGINEVQQTSTSISPATPPVNTPVMDANVANDGESINLNILFFPDPKLRNIALPGVVGVSMLLRFRVTVSPKEPFSVYPFSKTASSNPDVSPSTQTAGQHIMEKSQDVTIYERRFSQSTKWIKVPPPPHLHKKLQLFRMSITIPMTSLKDLQDDPKYQNSNNNLQMVPSYFGAYSCREYEAEIIVRFDPEKSVKVVVPIVVTANSKPRSSFPSS